MKNSDRERPDAGPPYESRPADQPRSCLRPATWGALGTGVAMSPHFRRERRENLNKAFTKQRVFRAGSGRFRWRMRWRFFASEQNRRRHGRAEGQREGAGAVFRAQRSRHFARIAPAPPGIPGGMRRPGVGTSAPDGRRMPPGGRIAGGLRPRRLASAGRGARHSPACPRRGRRHSLPDASPRRESAARRCRHGARAARPPRPC